MASIPALGHAADRAFERYGIVITGEEMTQILLDILDSVDGTRSAAIRQTVTPWGREVWFVRLRGSWIRVAYAPEAAFIMTVLPLVDDRR